MASDDPLPNSSSISPASGLKKVFTKNKSKSLLATTGADDTLQPRSSIESPERSPNRPSNDSSRDGSSKSSGSGIAKLIPGHSKRQRRRNRASELRELEAEDERGRSSISEAAPSSLHPPSRTQSSSSLVNDGESSLLTDDSDPEGSRPSLTPHDSHSGYLTTSSPLITTTSVGAPEPKKSNSIYETTGDDLHLPNLDRAETSPVGDHTATTSPIPELPPHSESTPNIPLVKTDTLNIPSDERTGRRRGNSLSDSIRGLASGGKLKDVFTITNPNKGANSSPDRASIKSTGSGSGGLVGGLIGKKGGSITARRSVKEDSTPPPPEIRTSYPEEVPASKPDISLDTPKRPRTPPTAILPGPLTTVTPPTPTEDKPRSINLGSQVKPLNNGIVVSPSGNMISHRRVKSEHQPSKLSNSLSLTPSPSLDDAKVPKPANASSFFSSWMSAAQNAATQITSTITPQVKSRIGTQNTEPEKPQVLEPTPEEDTASESQSSERRQLAVETLGMGDLNFGHLGLDASGSSDDRPSASAKGDSTELKQSQASIRDEAAARIEDARATKAISAAYEKTARDGSTVSLAEDNQTSLRHRDTISSNFAGSEKTPPTSIFEGEIGASIKRSNSSRSRLGRRRNRGSSGATHSTIGAIIGASTTTLAHPASGPRLTGFAVAPKARNRSFHQLFRSVPDDDYLIEDYSCALQRDILLAGRIYISEGHICFSSNILGWVTTLVISFDEVMSIEKESTAMVFPNAIAIQTLHARHTFRSLLSRDATYDLMIGIWKVSHPGTFKSSLNGVHLESGTGDKTEKTRDAENSDESDEDDEIYDEDAEEDEEADSFVESGEGSVTSSEISAGANAISRKPSALNNASASAPALPLSVAGDVQQGEKIAAAVAEATGNDFPGPSTHGPTDCTDSATHFEKVVKDETIPAPLGKIYTMLFGTNSPMFVTKFLLEEQKVTELQFEDKKGLSSDIKSRQYSYIKPLGGSIGPKSTKCITTENLDFFDLEKSVSVTCTTQTPDVPSGNAFSVKTRYCLSWAPGNATRIQMNCGIEWTAKSWLKGPIEKGAIDGQLSYGNELVKSLKAGVSARSRGAVTTSKTSKGKKRRRDTKSSSAPKVSEKDTKKASDWGIFEPLHAIFGIVGDIAGPLFSTNVIIIILLSLVLITWLRGPIWASAPANGLTTTPNRLAAYEELWQKEESELWHWLEERVGVDGISSQAMAHGKAYNAWDKKDSKDKAKQRSKILNGKDMAARLREEKMTEREVEEAIRVTQERLDVLKEVMKKNKKSDKAPRERKGVDGSLPTIRAKAEL